MSRERASTRNALSRRERAGVPGPARPRRGWASAAALAALLASSALAATPAAAQCTVTADVVAMDQVLIFNRMGAFNPAGMIFALSRDVFPQGTTVFEEANSCANAPCSAGDVMLRPDKRPRPLTLRVNEGCRIDITLTNLLSPTPITDAANEAPGITTCEPPDITSGLCQSEQPATRNVGIHVSGLRWATGPGDDGSNVGNNMSSLAGAPQTYKLLADKEGAYTITSGPNLGGEGGSGALASGLFGVLNVEPAGSEWYRSQLTRFEMDLARDRAVDLGELQCGTLNDPDPGYTCAGQPILDYDAVYPPLHPYAGQPILRILDGAEIVHNELNAVITGPGRGNIPGEPSDPMYPDRGRPFREFTVAFHDEIKVVQAFPGWFDSLPFTLGSVKDGFGINYGTGGIGAEIIGNRLGVGPMHPCVECKYEEFFLTSWAVGDPAMIVDVPANAGLEALTPTQAPGEGTTGPKATRAFYPGDPSNVWHGYLNDRTKVRNIHVGTEHHIFHLHAHQWQFASLDGASNYLDAQAIGPGSSFTYEISWGGGGNRNRTAGDSIFHCHFYPHFAQGMWGLWRVHDTFEMGSVLDPDGRVTARGLPDSEICTGVGDYTDPMSESGECGGYDAAGNALAGGTPTPGVVPIPGQAMAPMPGSYVVDTDGDGLEETAFMGYPFYIPGVAGHRPRTPPMDLEDDGGLPRHVITGGTALATQTPTDFDKVLHSATGYQLPEDGTAAEKAAMAFHGPQADTYDQYHSSFAQNATGGVTKSYFEVNGLAPAPGAPYADPCRGDSWSNSLSLPWSPTWIGEPRTYRASVIELDVDLNKVGWHFGQQRIIVLDGDVGATKSGARAPEPFVMRANTNDCVTFYHTNLVPNVYQLDDFQVRTPTDVIGQHIHLVKFDVMSADGAANGWNYEDGTFSPDEIAERIHALKDPTAGSWTGAPLGGSGQRTTVQRWFIDPGWEGNVFTHDHYGPSTHQQAGLYATMLIEPKGATFSDPTTGAVLNPRTGDGGPTSWRADVKVGNDAWREFYLEFADFQLAYRSGAGDGAGLRNGPNQPVNPSDRNEVGLPDVLLPSCLLGGETPTGCRPEAISAADPGTFVVNYRNEPLALRLRALDNTQALGFAGDLSWAFSSMNPTTGLPLKRADERLNGAPSTWRYGIQTATEGALEGDPFTPILRAYEGDKVRLRVQVGAHEEGHNFSMNGVKWLQQWRSPYSGFRNSQMAGISEYFVFKMPPLSRVRGSQEFEDYMYQAGSSVDARWNGSWGLMRSYKGAPPAGSPPLKPLPNNPDGQVPPGNEGGFVAGVCPQTAPSVAYAVMAVAASDVLPDLGGRRPGAAGFDGGTLVYNKLHGLHDPTALLYVLEDDLELRDPDDAACLNEFGNPRKPTRVDIGLPGCTADRIRLRADAPVEPLMLRANAGDCVKIELFNKLPPVLADPAGFNLLPMIVNQFNANQIAPSAHVGLHAQLVSYAMSEGDGMNVGFNNVQTAAPGGGKAEYVWYAGSLDTDPETGTRVATPVEFGAINLMASDPIEGSSKGLIGALIVEPQGSTWMCDQTGRAQGVDCYGGGRKGLPTTRASATINTGAGNHFRDFVLLFQDDVNMQFADGTPVPIVAEEVEPEDSGMKGLNYRTEPIWARLEIPTNATAEDTRLIDFSDAFSGTPETPVFTASTGEQVRFRILKPGGHNRNHVFALHGHLWARHPYNAGSTEIKPDNPFTFWHGEQMGHGPTNHFDAVPLGGAGASGDHLYRDMVPVHVYNGIWGLFRVN